MALDKFERQLDLLLLLTSNQTYNIEQLAQKLGMSWRTVYRYLELFKKYGFVVTVTDGIYSLDKKSTYFRNLAENISFTEDEVIKLKRVLQASIRKHPEHIFLLKKLIRVYGADTVEFMEDEERFSENYRLLEQAITEKNQVLLKGYSSGHSGQTSDRWVEPFAFLSNNSQVRCYEINSGLNKSFSISRITEVGVLPSKWEHDSSHQMVYTDAFRFSGEEQYEIKLRLNLLSLNLLREEYDVKSETITREDDEHWIYQDKVCSFIGVGRFVLGLPGELEVLENDEFKAYIREQMLKYSCL